MLTLGIDTSNYTTSCAVYDSEKNQIIQRKKLLPVKDGEKGLRQSDAVFHHTQQLYPLIADLFREATGEISLLGVSEKPRDAQGSYMPCFTVGINTAHSIAAVINKPVYGFSHQSGHIMAALYSSGRTDLISQRFIAFHISGGTTEALLVEPDDERIFKANILGETKDLNCGQAVDRAGVMMGMHFPCGRELEALALKSEKDYNPRICVADGNCCLSGLENICQKMLSANEKKEDVAKFCLDFAGKTIEKMTESALSRAGELPVIYAGGVMSNSIIRSRLQAKFNCYFAQPEFSCDNAAGTAILAYYRGQK